MAKPLEDLSYVDVVDLLTSTGVKNISESGGEVSFSCPGEAHFHGDHSPSARMNRRTTAFICHGCGQRGNAVSFLAWHKSLPETVARRLIEERYGGGRISAPVGGLEQEVLRIMNPPEIVEEERITPSESWLAEFYKGINDCEEAQKYLEKRGFGQQVSEEWELGYDYFSKRITIPIRDIDGKLVGFKGRAIHDGPFPKYMILGDRHNQEVYGFQPYQKSKYVFGLDRFSSYKYKEAAIVEGELNAIAMNKYVGLPFAIGIAGSEFSETQRDLIKTNVDRAVIFLDNDESGMKGTRQVVDMLSPYMQLTVVQEAPGDAAELDKETISNLIDLAVPVLELQVMGKL